MRDESFSCAVFLTHYCINHLLSLVVVLGVFCFLPWSGLAGHELLEAAALGDA